MACVKDHVDDLLVVEWAREARLEFFIAMDMDVTAQKFGHHDICPETVTHNGHYCQATVMYSLNGLKPKNFKYLP